MAYQDPYANNYGSGSLNFQRQQHPTMPGPQFTPTYRDSQETYEQDGYNPYSANSEYRDDAPGEHYEHYDQSTGGPGTYPPGPQRQLTKRSSVAGGNAATERGMTFDRTPSFPEAFRKERTARALRNYRHDHQGNLWMKGGRGRCVGRCCCCTLMIAILLFVSIVLALALWLRPPGVEIGSVQPTAVNGSAVQLQEAGVTVNLAVNITVNNPNFFSVSFKSIKAELLYPLNGNVTNIGSGESDNLVFNARSNKTFVFPFSIDYKKAQDPQSLILLDLAQKCGATGSPNTDISVDYKITLGLRILFVTITPVIANTFTFLCPLNAADLSKLLGSGSG